MRDKRGHKVKVTRISPGGVGEQHKEVGVFTLDMIVKSWTVTVWPEDYVNYAYPGKQQQVSA